LGRNYVTSSPYWEVRGKAASAETASSAKPKGTGRAGHSIIRGGNKPAERQWEDKDEKVLKRKGEVPATRN